MCTDYDVYRRIFLRNSQENGLVKPKPQCFGSAFPTYIYVYGQSYLVPVFREISSGLEVSRKPSLGRSTLTVTGTRSWEARMSSKEK